MRWVLNVLERHNQGSMLGWGFNIDDNGQHTWGALLHALPKVVRRQPPRL